MPFSFYKKIELPKLQTTRMDIHMEDPSVTYPRGLVEDFLVKVENFVFPDNFVVLDMKEDDTYRLFLEDFSKVPLIPW